MTPFATSLTIASLAPAVVGHLGGEEVMLTGTFPDGPYDVFVASPDGEKRCFPADRGTELDCYPDDGASMRIVVPPLTAGAQPYSISVRQGATRFDLVNVITVKHLTFFKKVYDLRAILPPTWDARPRSLHREALAPAAVTVNQAPVIDPVADQQITFAGGLTTVQPTFTDGDGAPGVYAWAFAGHGNTPPGWITVDGPTGEVSMTAPSATPVVIAGLVLSLFDGELYSYSNAFDVEVTG